MIEKNFGGLTLIFEKENDDYLVITGFSGSDVKLELPVQVEADGKVLPVKKVSKKAFLGCKGLKEVYVPSSIEAIEDWGFSQCIHLSSIFFGKDGMPKLGRSVFDGCERLSAINIEGEGSDLSAILAAVVNKLPSSHLLNDNDIGSKSFYERFDLSLKAFVMQDDYEGYSDRALCGEEDISYDGIGSVDGELLGESQAYLRKVGRDKAGLVYLRLLNPSFLAEDMKMFFEDYIKKHQKGQLNEASWLSIKEDYKDNMEYLKKYLDIVMPDAKAIDEMISDMGSDMALAKAFLIKRVSAESKTEKVFDDLLL